MSIPGTMQMAAAGVALLIAGASAPLGSRLEAGDRSLGHVLADFTRLPPKAARMHTYVTKPMHPGELAYRRIPWLVDLHEGMRLAREEHRPLLLWTSGDDPLDRC